MHGDIRNTFITFSRDHERDLRETGWLREVFIYPR